MARLEIDIVGNNTELKKVLADSKIALSNFNKELTGNELKTAKVNTEALKSALVAQRVETEKSRTATQQARQAIAELTLANRGSKTAFDAASGSYDEARQRLASLRKAIFEAKGGLDGTRPSIKAMVSEYNTLNTRLKAFDAQMGNHQREVGNYAKGLGNATGVTMEFTRIIQDAPYGMMGIGNNIQQLTANWQQYVIASKAASAAQGLTITTGGLLKGALTALISPASLLSLGIAAVTSGWVMYEKWAQRSKKATEDNEKQLKSYIETLSGVQRAQANGLSESKKELTSLKLLYDATQNLSLPMNKRREAAQELIKQYPDQLKGLSQESILAGQAAKAYDNLTKSITATAIATATANKMTENAQKQLNNYLEILDKQNKANKLRLQIESAQRVGEANGIGGSQGVFGATGNAQLQYANTLRGEYADLMKEINDLGVKNSNITDENILLQKNYNKQLENGADIVSGKGSKTKGKSQADIIKEANEALRGGQIDNLKGIDNELGKIDKKWDSILEKVNKISNVELKNQLKTQVEQGRELDKQLAKLDAWSKGKNLTGISGRGTIAPTLSPIPSIENLKNSQAGFVAGISSGFKDKEGEQLQKEISRIVKGGVRRGFDDIISNIDDLGSNFYQVFTNVFGKLASSIQSTLNDVVGNSLGNLIKENFGNIKFGNLSKEVSQGIVAGVGALGNVLGGMFKGTDSTGQAISGALTGAAAGMALGPIGAVAGGLIGAISGIFGAKERKRQLALQEEQLKEQRKQTLLQERANALAYSSSIIGQMTNRGIVQGVDVNAFGELTFRIEGRDLVATMNKEQEAQKRGL